MAAQPSPRRRFQFRLRTLLIVVTLLAVPLRLRRLAGEDRAGVAGDDAADHDRRKGVMSCACFGVRELSEPTYACCRQIPAHATLPL